MWWVLVWVRSKWVNVAFQVKFDLEGHSHPPPPPPQKKKQNNRDLNQVVVHILFKLGGSNLNAWWGIMWRTSGMADTNADGHTHIDIQTQATAIPEGQNCNYCYQWCIYIHQGQLMNYHNQIFGDIIYSEILTKYCNHIPGTLPIFPRYSGFNQYHILDFTLCSYRMINCH